MADWKSKHARRIAFALGTATMVWTMAGSAAAAQNQPPETQPAAQSDAGVHETEIFVTARRREERLIDVPVSVSAFGGEELQSRSFSDISDLSGTVPNVNFDAGTNSIGSGAAASIYIRGIGQDDFLPTSDPGVGVYLDNVYLGRTVGQVLSAIDIERLEVLRGPQGTLFGRNTIGGAINVTLRRPQPELGGFVRVEGGTDDLFDIAGRIDLPIAEQLLAAVTAGYRTRDGFARSPNAPRVDFGDDDKINFRAQASILPATGLRIDLSFDYFEQSENAEPSINYAADFGNPNTLGAFYNSVAALIGEAPYTSADLGSQTRPNVTLQTGPSRDDLEVWGIAGNVYWDVSDRIRVRSTTAWRELQGRFESDQDGTARPIAFIDEKIRQHQFSQELQLTAEVGSLNLVSGLYYFTENAVDDNDVPIVPGVFAALGQLPGAVVPLAPYPSGPDGLPLFTCPAAPPGFPCAGGPGNPLNVALDQTIRIFSEMKVDNYAAYAHLNWDLSDHFSVSLGGRVTHERKTFFAFQSRIESSAALGTTIYNLAPRESRDSWTQFTPHVGAQYRIADGQMVYASFNRGFRSGTFNGRANSIITFAAVDPEIVDAYEIGYKGEFLDRRLRFSLAGFLNDYKDIQLRAVIPSTTGVDVFLINAASATIQGVEAELLVQPSRAIQFGGTFGFADSEIEDVDPAVATFTGITPGNVLAKTPRHTFSLFGQADVETGIGRMQFRADYNWRSSIFHDAANTSIPGVGTTREGAYGLLDARITWFAPGDDFSVAVFGRNLTDETRFASLFANAGGQLIAYPVRGRELGVSARFDF